MSHVKNKNNTNDKVKKKNFYNSKQEDASAKLIFGDPILCAQFIRGYTGIALLQDIQPEDIEDVTERFVHMFAEERNSDVIKKVRLKNNEVPFYLISLIEHKSKVDYNTIMQILRYMVFIWEDYEKEQERLHPGISKTKGFLYPPILPIIYYTGSSNWTAAVKLADRVYLSDILSEYIPNFRCILVQVKNFSNFQLMEKHDELSILMMINKMHKSTDFSKWKEEVDLDYLEDTTEKTPEYLLGIMAHMIELLLKNINVPGEEAENVAGKVKERDMAGLFDHFEKYDVQATRAEARQLGVAEGRAEGRIQMLIEDCQEFNVNKEDTFQRLVKKLALTEEEANRYMKEYWNEE